MNVIEWFLARSENLYITSSYGLRIHPISGELHFHQGVDIAGEYEGFPTVSPSAGEVTLATYSESYGYYLNFQQNGADYYIRIAHLQSLNVTNGMEIEGGFNMGGMGTSGSSTGVHWHIETWVDGSHVDPETVEMYVSESEPTDPPQKPTLTPLQIMLNRRFIQRRR